MPNHLKSNSIATVTARIILLQIINLLNDRRWIRGPYYIYTIHWVDSDYRFSMYIFFYLFKNTASITMVISLIVSIFSI